MIRYRYLPCALERVAYKIESRARRFYNLRKKLQFPEQIMVQTTSSCNASCTICPYPEISKTIKHGEMSREVFGKILKECGGHRVKRIFLYLMNEPLLDKKIIEKAKLVREMLPKTEIFISTNASLLSPKMSRSLIGVVDELQLHVSGFGKEEYEKIMRGLSYERVMSNIIILAKIARHKKVRVRVVNVVKKNSISNSRLREIRNFWLSKGLKCNFRLYYDRAGNILGEHENSAYKDRCWIYDAPLNTIHILFNGDVVLCCSDWRRKHILGNVKTMSIEQIWRSEEYKRMRDALYKGKVDDDMLCSRCADSGTI
ncbi:MAG: SPASM domain-containing protein [Candidatus Woesearchaeota archaeon]